MPSLRPSKFTKNNKKPQQRATVLEDVRIHCPCSLHNFNKMIALYVKSLNQPHDTVVRTLSAMVEADGWDDPRIKYLHEAQSKLDEVSWNEDDFCLDSSMTISKTFRPGETDGEVSLRLASRAVKDGLSLQASLVNIPAPIYIQLMMAKRVLSSHRVTTEKSKSAQVMLSALERYEKWVNYVYQRMSQNIANFSEPERS